MSSAKPARNKIESDSSEPEIEKKRQQREKLQLNNQKDQRKQKVMARLKVKKVKKR